MSRGTLDTGLSLGLSHTGLLPSVVVLSFTVLLDFENHYTGPQPLLSTLVVMLGKSFKFLRQSLLSSFTIQVVLLTPLFDFSLNFLLLPSLRGLVLNLDHFSFHTT